jgi:S-(hydroxymethyl)glutathione dehydrogenase / alcohol dehydrogenase
MSSTIAMKGAVLTHPKQPLKVLSDMECPAPRRGQVLVKLAYSGVCRSQLMEALGHRGQDAYLPHLLGHEGTGKVIDVGEGITKVKRGDLVVLTWIKSSGLDSGGMRYRCGCMQQEINAGGVTTFNDYALVSENRVVPLPLGIPLDIGVLFGCALPTGAGIILNDLRPHPKSSIGIFGLGGIGLSALIATTLFNCEKVIAIDISTDKLALARSFGATHTINSKKVNPVDEIRAITGGTGLDYSVEASGLVRVIEQSFEATRRGGGICVFASHPPYGEQISIDPYELICGKHIRGSWGGSCDPDRDIPILANLYLEHKFPLEKLIDKRYTLDTINEALSDLEHLRVERPLIEIDPSIF